MALNRAKRPRGHHLAGNLGTEVAPLVEPSSVPMSTTSVPMRYPARAPGVFKAHQEVPR